MKNILMVDDNLDICEVYRIALESRGYSVQLAHDGESALAAIQQFQPDLILLDIMMPKIQGLDVLDIVKGTPEYASIQIVMLSALSDKAVIEKATERGAAEFIVKSEETMEQVVGKISHLLESE